MKEQLWNVPIKFNLTLTFGSRFTFLPFHATMYLLWSRTLLLTQPQPPCPFIPHSSYQHRQAFQSHFTGRFNLICPLTCHTNCSGLYLSICSPIYSCVFTQATTTGSQFQQFEKDLYLPSSLDKRRSKWVPGVLWIFFSPLFHRIYLVQQASLTLAQLLTLQSTLCFCIEWGSEVICKTNNKIKLGLRIRASSWGVRSGGCL